MEPVLCCYRLDSLIAYDEEQIWSLVQRHGGSLSIRGDCIDFWIPQQYQTVLVLAFPGLRRQFCLDYV